MDQVTLIGPRYAGFLKSARVALAEKGVVFAVEHFDFPERPPGFIELNPFGKVPVLRHGDFVLHETVAILGYIDDAFDGPALRPATPRGRARVAQAISLMDQIAADALMRAVFVERFRAMQGATPDEARVAAELARGLPVLDLFETWLRIAPYLAGGAVTLADMHAFPSLRYFFGTPEGVAALAVRPALAAWSSRCAARPAFAEHGLPELPLPAG